MNDLIKYKSIIVSMRYVLTKKEYISTLLFIKYQRKVLIKREGLNTFKDFKIDKELLLLIMGYLTKIIIKIDKDKLNDENLYLLSANKKIYKEFHKLTNFNINIFEKEELYKNFHKLKTKEREVLILSIKRNKKLFLEVDMEVLEDLNLYIRNNKLEAMDYFNNINYSIGVFLEKNKIINLNL